MDAELIATHVHTLREGDDASKTFAARALGNMACIKAATRVPIAEAGGIPLLLQLLRGPTEFVSDKYWAARTLGNLAYHNDANKVAIAEGGGIPPLLQLRCGRIFVPEAAAALGNLVHGNDAHAVAVAATVGLEALVQLARRGRATVDSWLLVLNATLPAKRKAALVVAALLRDCVPEFKSAPRDIKAVIGSYL